jgi:hypothetical protein
MFSYIFDARLALESFSKKILKEAESEAMTSIVHQIFFSVSQLRYISPTLVLFYFDFRQRACHLRTMMHFA